MLRTMLPHPRVAVKVIAGLLERFTIALDLLPNLKEAVKRLRKAAGV